MIIWFCHQIASTSICCDKFNISICSPILHCFSKKYIVYHHKKIFFQIIFYVFLFRSIIISTYGFSQAFWLNLITLWTYFKTNLWFNGCFRFLMCIANSVLPCKLATTFRIFQLTFFLVKMVNNYEVHVIFSDIEHQFKKISFIPFIIVFTKYSLKWKVSLIHSKLFIASFSDIARLYELFTSQYWTYDNSLFFVIIFHVFVIIFKK